MKSENLVLICPDGRAGVGFGHISRCLTIAEQLSALNENFKFLMTDNVPTQFLSSLTNTVFGTDVFSAAVTLKATCVVLDGYGFPDKWAKKLADRNIKVIVIDDNGLPLLPIDLIINPNNHAQKRLYQNNCCLGPDFALIRSGIRAKKSLVNKTRDVNKVSICIGGSDPNGVSLIAAQSLVPSFRRGKAFEVNLILGPLSDGKLIIDAKQFIHDSLPNANLFVDPDNFIDLINDSDMAIVSGGVILTECIFLGVPTISMIIAENQKEGVLAWEKNKATVVALANIESLEKAFEKLFSDSASRLDLSKNGQKLVDGQGVLRVCENIQSLFNHSSAP
jgi:UDP-2,4-diacetamido-2,4,6-trideoxy-beta-L-altropyranose hydrolase